MMKEILITSSVLILAVLAIRQLFKRVLSRRLQYGLWALVLVRLLVPVSLPAVNFSILTATQPVQAAVALRLERPIAPLPAQPVTPQPVQPMPVPEVGPESEVPPSALPVSHPSSARTVGEVLKAVWLIGMAAMGGFFLLSNLAFYGRLRKNRKPFASPGSRKVYLVPEGVIPSPCLFGRSIYITPAVASDPHRLRHVLIHEETHARHLDSLWSLLRCVCLTVYWFDPLVWVAAACSKTDCELACDESVLNDLGENERIPYGQTLLSLIPVKRVSNPVLAATTMTSGKKQLKDRVTRIAKRPRQLAAAALAVAVLAGVVSACTFTGGTPIPSRGPTENTLRPLTGEELRWFNEEFFNSSGSSKDQVYAVSGDGYQEYYNIRNQFLNSAFNLYEKPEDIDLFQLFYCDGSFISDEEVPIVWDGDPNDLPCGAYKLTTEEMDEILKRNTGLTLAQTDQIGLDNFIHQNDAYYWTHGDTNYPGDIEIVCGTREGSTVRLYHHGWNSGSEWYCTTLEAQPDGGYWFVSNQESQAPAIPTPLPAWDPVASIDLSALEPYTAPAVTVERHTDDFIDHYDYRLENWNFDGRNVVAYRSSTRPGTLHAAIRQEDGTMNVFFTTQEDNYQSMFFFHDLLGRDGFFVTYRTGANPRFYATDTDYYYFDENGVLTLLARCQGESQIIDLDGDGQSELVTPRQLFFQREGVVYEARLDELLLSACPELSYWDYESWDRYGKCLYVNGLSAEAMWERYLYFDGENLLVYKNEKPTTDHMVDGADDGVPAEVVAKAREYVQGVLPQNDSEGMGAVDDWRIDYFRGPYTTHVGDATVEAWAFNYECHTTTPENVVLAGGRYITEDNWVSPGYPGCDWLFFQRTADGSLVFLWHDMINDMGPYSLAYGQYLEQRLAQLDFDIGSVSFAALDAARKLEYMMDHSGGQITLMLTPPEGEGTACTVSPDSGNSRYYQQRFTDPEAYRWSYVDSFPGYPEGTFLTITDPTWDYFIRLWEDSDLVMIKESNAGAVWYRAESVALPPDDVFYYRTLIFNFMRGWFDEAEWTALTGGIAIPDEGQSRQAIAQAWVDAYEGAKLRTTPGGHYTCTYIKNIQVKAEETAETPESWFPEEILPYDHFRFSYSTIFVPENTDAQNYMMAGNTAEYEGDDPGVPAGAFQHWLIGAMYLKDGYWYCGSLGTG